MTPSLFAWSPYIALALGLAVGLLARTPARTLFGVLTAAILLQVLGWAVIFVAAAGWSHDWQTTLGAGFLWGLLVVVPFTVIGAAASAGAAMLCRRGRGQVPIYDSRHRLDE